MGGGSAAAHTAPRRLLEPIMTDHPGYPKTPGLAAASAALSRGLDAQEADAARRAGTQAKRQGLSAPVAAALAQEHGRHADAFLERYRVTTLPSERERLWTVARAALALDMGAPTKARTAAFAALGDALAALNGAPLAFAGPLNPTGESYAAALADSAAK